MDAQVACIEADEAMLKFQKGKSDGEFRKGASRLSEVRTFNILNSSMSLSLSSRSSSCTHPCPTNEHYQSAQMLLNVGHTAAGRAFSLYVAHFTR